MGVPHSNQTLSPNSWRSQLQVVLDSSKKQLYPLVPWFATGGPAGIVDNPYIQPW